MFCVGARPIDTRAAVPSEAPPTLQMHQGLALQRLAPGSTCLAGCERALRSDCLRRGRSRCTRRRTKPVFVRNVAQAKRIQRLGDAVLAADECPLCEQLARQGMHDVFRLAGLARVRECGLEVDRTA
jgi:hypothetical protein